MTVNVPERSKWRLMEVTGETACTMDASGFYVHIHRQACVLRSIADNAPCGKELVIRVDVFTTTDEPVISFVGPGNAVRKQVAQWFMSNAPDMSYEHASYIGYEIARAMAYEHYEQD